MHDFYLAHADLVAPPASEKPDFEATIRAVLPVQPSSWERAFRLAGQDETYDEVIAATEYAHRAWLLDIWRRHPGGQIYEAFAHMLAITATPLGEPRPIHADPEVEYLSGLTPPEMADELVARGVTSDPVEAARIVEEAATAVLAAHERKPWPSSLLPQFCSFES